MSFNGNSGIAVGKDLLAISSSDAGETWTVDTTPLVRKQLNSVSISPSGNCWTVGDSGFIFRKHLSEKKWTYVNSGTIINLTNVSTIGDSVIIITGGMQDTAQVGKHFNILLFSNDNGASWLSTTLAELKTIYSAYFFDADTGFICGTNGIISKSYQIFNQRSQQLSGTATALNKIDFYNNNGLIVGDGGTILRSTNRGGRGLTTSYLSVSPIRLFPNPSKGNFTIIHPETGIISVKAFDCTGKEVSVNFNNDIYTIKQSGTYTLQVLLENRQVWHTTIVIH
jgi:hypothetical protein